LNKSNKFSVNHNFFFVVIWAGSLIFIFIGFSLRFLNRFDFSIGKVGFDFFFGSLNNFFNKSGSGVFVSSFNGFFGFFGFFVGIFRDDFSGLVIDSVSGVGDLDEGSGGVFFFSSVNGFFDIGNLSSNDTDGFAQSVFFFTGVMGGFFKGFGGVSEISFFSFSFCVSEFSLNLGGDGIDFDGFLFESFSGFLDIFGSLVFSFSGFFNLFGEGLHFFVGGIKGFFFSVQNFFKGLECTYGARIIFSF
jgi:hypothetical protein